MMLSAWMMGVIRGAVPSGIEVFTSSGTFAVPPGIQRVDVLLVGGGGGGGATSISSSNVVGRGGGGAGGVHAVWNVPVSSGGSVSVDVGLGGAGGVVAGPPEHRSQSGGNSSFAENIAFGGGGGGPSDEFASGSAGANGGSGGGSGFREVPPGYGAPGEGFSGGNATGSASGGAGGGGASAVGGDAPSDAGSAGGAGRSLSYYGFEAAVPLGAPSDVGGGGGGGAYAGTPGGASHGGGIGGSGDYGTGSDGAPNTGGGGGGLGGGTGVAITSNKGGDGAAGLVVVRYGGDVVSPLMNSNSAATYDGSTLTFDKDADTPRLMASITKLMTLRLLRQWVVDLDTTITVISDDLVGGTSAGLMNNDVISYRDLVYCMTIPSGNDAARAVGRTVGQLIIDGAGPGSSTTPLTRFTQAMNIEASTLGLSNTTYNGCSGVNLENNTQSARDACVLAYSLLSDSFLVEALGTLSYEITITGPNARTPTIAATFDPVGGTVKFPEFVGRKTGGTGSTFDGDSVAFIWEHPDNGPQISVTLDAPRNEGPNRVLAKYRDTRNLINYGLAT